MRNGVEQVRLHSIWLHFLFRLRRLENYGVLKAHQYDPMTYMIHLEPSGFREIKVRLVHCLINTYFR